MPLEIPPGPTTERSGHGLREDAVLIVCAVRQQRIPVGGDLAKGTYQVGGFVQLAQIDKGAISSVIAHRWPDAIGARLDPSNELLCPPPLAQNFASSGCHENVFVKVPLMTSRG